MCIYHYEVQFKYDGKSHKSYIDSSIPPPKPNEDNTQIWDVADLAIEQEMKTIERKEGILPCDIFIYNYTNGERVTEWKTVRED